MQIRKYIFPLFVMQKCQYKIKYPNIFTEKYPQTKNGTKAWLLLSRFCAECYSNKFIKLFDKNQKRDVLHDLVRLPKDF
ncbi:hypothetical protein SAMN05421780_104166 [Flexibacter flexilis DSM 6793]|uniref:Uncharacterized protein n=1 Tax=Flexibacter flexilis DSM 6793 TaxID=927664 RepID=A0A1I1I168_9BACT|nr:hypothetical protein SAMN05421780_104166 [Flexibacter flexilis DSM 6793]